MLAPFIIYRISIETLQETTNFVYLCTKIKRFEKSTNNLFEETLSKRIQTSAVEFLFFAPSEPNKPNQTFLRRVSVPWALKPVQIRQVFRLFSQRKAATIFLISKAEYAIKKYSSTINSMFYSTKRVARLSEKYMD